MQFAIIGDIHSSIEDLQRVLSHIQKTAPQATIIGTGDLFECTISKRFINDRTYSQLSEVMILPEGFEELLTFPSVIGNQEERILYITDSDEELRSFLQALPERLNAGRAEVVHGHQWKWGGEPWSLLEAESSKSLTFYGHSHQSGLMRDGQTEAKIEFGKPYLIDSRTTLVNVGAVVDDQEWVLFDDDVATVTFMKAN